MTPAARLQPARGPSLAEPAGVADAALRRVAALMAAETAELPAHGRLRPRLAADVAIGGWGDIVLPELSALMRELEPGRELFVRERAPHPPLRAQEEAAARRLAALLRAEAAELADATPASARRLDAWGIRLAIECQRPQRLRRHAV